MLRKYLLFYLESQFKSEYFRDFSLIIGWPFNGWNDCLSFCGISHRRSLSEGLTLGVPQITFYPQQQNVVSSRNQPHSDGLWSFVFYSGQQYYPIPYSR